MVLQKKAEVGEVSIVKREKSLPFERGDRSGYDDYFGRKMRFLKSKKRINRKNCSPQCYSFSLSSTEYFCCLYQELSPKQSSSNRVKTKVE